MKYYECPYCHAHLDWGERCTDCKEKENEEPEAITDCMNGNGEQES